MHTRASDASCLVGGLVVHAQGRTHLAAGASRSLTSLLPRPFSRNNVLAPLESLEQGEEAILTESAKPPRVRSEVILLSVSILAFWVTALVVWWASLWHVGTYWEFGKELPGFTKIVASSARAGLPFILAAFFTAAVVYQILRSGHRPVMVTAWLLCATIACSSFVMFALAAPLITMCDEFLPSLSTTSELRRDSTESESLANESRDGCTA